jgi:outer membrane protein assembly factor BamD (BamD/ComL family)
VIEFIASNFVPVKIHIKEEPQTFKKFGVQWTPTLLVMAPDGEEAFRIEGFLPVEDFLAQLELGLGKAFLHQEKFTEAETNFRDVAKRYPKTESAPQALYWAGVAAYKGSKDPGKLKETYQNLLKQFPTSEWTRKGVVWAG